MRALACWGWLASNRTALNTSPRPPSTRFRNSCAWGGVPGSSSRTVGIRAILGSLRFVLAAGYTKPILNRSQKSGESLATSQLEQHYRQRTRRSRARIVGHFHLVLTGEKLFNRSGLRPPTYG